MFAFILFSVFLISCSGIKKPENSFYGKWIESKEGSVSIVIDSSIRSLVIDYSATGGKTFRGKYSLVGTNEIISDILPKGAKMEFDKKGNLNFYPLDKKYSEDIELVYAVRFKKADR